MIEWLITCFYTVSAMFLILSIWSLFSLFKLTWWLPLKAFKLLFSLLLCFIFFITANQLAEFFVSKTGTKIAEINIRYLDKQQYLVTFTKPELSNSKQVYEINGDEWQLDLRFITWHKLIASLGIDALFRFERVAGRYQSIDNELKAKRSIYSLTEDKISDGILRYIGNLYDGGVFRAYYGAALYGPMSDQASYGIFLTATGAEVLPLNEIAKKSLNKW